MLPRFILPLWEPCIGLSRCSSAYLDSIHFSMREALRTTSACQQKEQFGSPKVGKSCTALLRPKRGREKLTYTQASNLQSLP
jgi:hypothetical protein